MRGALGGLGVVAIALGACGEAGGDRRPLENIPAGSLVTITRMTAGLAPTEVTEIADGGSLRLQSDRDEVAIAMVTDPDGQLLATQVMGSRCSLLDAPRLEVPSDYPTIQSAIDAASRGDIVKVAPGTYTESLVMRPGVCLLGSGPAVTVLDARLEHCNLIDLTGAAGALVAGFTFRRVRNIRGCVDPDDPFVCAGDWYRAAIYAEGLGEEDPTQLAPPIIAGNRFEENVLAVMLYWHPVAVVRNNVFVGNRNGVATNHLMNRSLVASNLFLENTHIAVGVGIAELHVVGNVVARSGIAVAFDPGPIGSIGCNLFWENADLAADFDIPRFTIGTDGNLEADPAFADPAAGDFHLTAASPGIDAGCYQDTSFEPDGSPQDIGAYGGPLGAWVDFQPGVSLDI